MIICTIFSLVLTNSPIGENYLKLWHFNLGLSVEHWINDGLMAIFFLLIGLELNRELKTGELSEIKKALLPVFATIAGVALAFTIPFSGKDDDETSPSYRLEHFLHKPVPFVILPIFALANTGIILSAESLRSLTNANEVGILSGLIFGKPFGIALFSFAVVSIGICKLPLDLNWKHIFGAGMLGGIGFTMSIFITNLAFASNAAEINGSKIAILLASLATGMLGFLWLKIFGQPEPIDDNPDTMDFHQTD